MANSGYTDIAVTNNTTLRFYWELNSQSVESNYSNISWVMQLITDAYGRISSTVTKSWSVNVDGQGYSGNNTVSIGTGSTKTLASGSKTIGHNSDGSKHFDYSFSQQFDISFSSGYVGTVNGSGGEWLPTIPRASEPSVSPSSVTMGNAITIYTNRKSSSFTHHIYYNWQGTNYTDGLSATSDIGDSVSFTPPKSLANNMTGSPSGTCTIYCDTYSGGTCIGTKACGLTIGISSDMKPTVSAVVTDSTGHADFFGGYIVGQSKYNVALTETGSYGSSISSRTVTMNSLVYTTNPAVSNVILSTSNNTIECQVKDSRGVLSDKLTISKTVYDYSAPKINSFSASRCNADGTANDEGEYVKVTYNVAITPLNNLNTKSLKVKYKKVSDSTYKEQSVTLSSYSQSGTVIIAANGLYSYDFVLSVNDHFTATEKTITISTAATTFDVFNNGKGIAFGKVAEYSNLFDCAWPIKASGGITNLVNLVYPIGSIYLSVSSTNPATLFGGTWVAWGTGRVPVGIDTSQSEFNAVEKTGGSKYLQSHTHIQDGHNHSQNAHGHGLRGGSHSFFWGQQGLINSVYAQSAIAAAGNPPSNNLTTSQGYWDSVSDSTASNNAATATNQYTGSGNSQNLQPYISCYMWKRTA